MNKIIKVKNLQKSYGEIQAVKDISFYVEQGKLFSFLGPNGAGKSTTIDIICTLLECDSGEIVIDNKKIGRDDTAIRNSIGIVFQDSLLDPLLTVGENLAIRGGFYFKDKNKLRQVVRNVAVMTGVMELMDRPYGKLSGGQRRRADIARALINTPKILFLDEPTTGLDPQTRKNIWDTIKRLKDETGMTVFLTTHYMEEADNSDYVMVIDHGEIVASGTPGELKQKYARDVLRLTVQNEQPIRDMLNETNTEFLYNGDQFTIKLTSTLSAIPIVERCKDFITGFEVLYGTMDDAFIGITGKELRE
ncbi:MAG: ATP-binding cassette domain-containing protein [Pelosinus sp.]|nr:ATP-binding cassette domain-containing protein [Pelosinus sp.]